jgi:hypothetical protein
VTATEHHHLQPSLVRFTPSVDAGWNLTDLIWELPAAAAAAAQCNVLLLLLQLTTANHTTKGCY